MAYFPAFALLTLSTLSSALESNSPQQPQSLTDTICDGRPRLQCEVELDVPQACSTSDISSVDPACPIVLFLHGRGQNNDGYALQSDAHDAGYIGVYPQGEIGWNTRPHPPYKCSWDDFDCSEDPDNGDFIASIIVELRSLGGNGNVYLIGNTNGASLSHRLAASADSSLRIKGIVTTVCPMFESPECSGPGELNYNQPCRGSPSVSVLSVMGTADRLVPYTGGTTLAFGGEESFQLKSALDSMQTWASHNGSDGTSVVDEHSSDMGTGATKYDYSSGCPTGITMEHYAINGGGHNSGSVSIDGEKMNYVVAYDFINRVEAGSVGGPPMSPPVASPVVSPVMSPVASPVSSPITSPVMSPVASPVATTSSSSSSFRKSQLPLVVTLVAMSLLG